MTSLSFPPWFRNFTFSKPREDPTQGGNSCCPHKRKPACSVTSENITVRQVGAERSSLDHLYLVAEKLRRTCGQQVPQGERIVSSFGGFSRSCDTFTSWLHSLRISQGIRSSLIKHTIVANQHGQELFQYCAQMGTMHIFSVAFLFLCFYIVIIIIVLIDIIIVKNVIFRNMINASFSCFQRI